MLLRGSAIFAIAVIGLTLAQQGWRSRLFNFDLIPYTDETAALLAGERLPEKGTLTSFGSYTPPGTAWLLAPGMAFMSDLRLYEAIGCAILYVGTLAGVFALAALLAPVSLAVLAAAVWGLSESGFFFAHSLWPRGHPFFFVWMVYFTVQWIRRRHDGWLAAAILIWAAGMFVFMEIAPAVVMLPAAWWFYRPPVRWRTLVFAGSIAFCIWLPYLRFESERDFIDIRSQLFRQTMYPQPNAGWCDPSLLPTEWIETHTEQGGFLKQALWTVTGRAEFGPSMAMANFESALSGAWVLLAIGVMGGLLAPVLIAASGISPRAFQYCGALLVVAPILVNEWTVSKFLSEDGILDGQSVLAVRSYGLAFLGVGACLVLFAKRLPKWHDRLSTHIGRFRNLENLKIVALCLALPWAALLISADAPRPERFWWLWSVQAVVLAAFLALLKDRVVRLVLCACVLTVSAVNVSSVARLESWATEGWAGKDAAALRAVDTVAQSMMNRGTGTSAIGYEIEFQRFMATLHATDHRYKVGKEFDFVFLRRHGLTNSNTCAEGVSSADVYRIVAHPGAGDPGERLNVTRDPKLRVVYADQNFTVLER